MIKPLHAQWLVNMFNFFTTRKGADVIVKGWKKAGIVGVLNGTIGEDPFRVAVILTCIVRIIIVIMLVEIDSLMNIN